MGALDTLKKDYEAICKSLTKETVEELHRLAREATPRELIEAINSAINATTIDYILDAKPIGTNSKLLSHIIPIYVAFFERTEPEFIAIRNSVLMEDSQISRKH